MVVHKHKLKIMMEIYDNITWGNPLVTTSWWSSAAEDWYNLPKTLPSATNTSGSN